MNSTDIIIFLIRDDADVIGRWKNSLCQHETYANTSIAYVYPKVTAAMCKGGVIAYLINEASGVTDAWVLEHVAPNMVNHGIYHQV
jgi:hypothetical protein